MANILSIAQSGLMAAQAGLATTGHNIANQGTPGYSRQIIVQTTEPGQNLGQGYIGSGTQVQTVLRQYDDFLGQQLDSINTSKGLTDTYYNQISNINTMLGDSSSGLTPVIQSFFASAQALSGGSNQVPQRTGLLSAAESLAGRFQSMGTQLQEMNDQVNTQIQTSVDAINGYAEQIAALNDAISKATASSTTQPPNDLLDQRDYLVSQLSQQTQVQIVKEGNNYSVFIGNGQPMVIGTTAWKLATTQSTSDPTQLEVGYVVGNNKVVPLSEGGLPGGTLGGLFQFRSQALTTAQNSLGRIALSIASTFNAQHELGEDLNGAMGTAFFSIGSPTVNINTNNTGTGALAATITDTNQLSTSNYTVGMDGAGNYYVTRLSDNKQVYPAAGTTTTTPPWGTTPPTEIDGVTFSMTGTMNPGDNFLVKPTANGATGFNVLITDPTLIAAAAPVLTEAPLTNTGTGTITAGSVDKNFAQSMVTTPINLVYDAASGTFNSAAVTPPATGTGFSFDVQVKHSDGTVNTYAAGTPVPYQMGDTWTLMGTTPATVPPQPAGITVQLAGTPKDGDTFTIESNPQTDSDNRNMNLLGALQTANTMIGGTTTYQGAFGQMVSAVGNKTSELATTQTAQANLQTQVTEQQQSLSGVNLDEEATNLIHYQQAYQASAKVMQAVKEMFDIIANIN
jgi:flagellar hook-associated protein 1 FlgK